MRPLRVAVIGVGNMGKAHVRNYLETPDVKLVAVADLSKEVGQEIAESANCQYYSKYEEMLEVEKPDFVSVVVPTALHHQVTLSCIQRRIHVLVEKPLSATIEDAQELIDTAKKFGVKLGIGHIERFNPAVIKLKEIIDSGTLGEINSIIIRRVGISPPQVKDVNVIIDLAIHDIDILNYLLEKLPDRVTAHGGRSIADNRTDYADLFLSYGQASALVQVNWITPVKIRKLNITGSKGYAELDYVTQEIVLFESVYHKKANNFGDFVINFGVPNKIEVEIEKEEPLKRELIDFIEFIKDKKDYLVTPQQALDALEIALKADKLIQTSS